MIREQLIFIDFDIVVEYSEYFWMKFVVRVQFTIPNDQSCRIFDTLHLCWIQKIDQDCSTLFNLKIEASKSNISYNFQYFETKFGAYVQ